MKDIITLYGNSGCRVCNDSKIKLQEAKISFRFIELKDLSKESLDTILLAKGQDRALPLVFVNNKYIGGPGVINQLVIKYGRFKI